MRYCSRTIHTLPRPHKTKEDEAGEVGSIHSTVSTGTVPEQAIPLPLSTSQEEKKEKKKETIQYETPNPAHPPFQKYPKQIIVLNAISAISET